MRLSAQGVLLRSSTGGFLEAALDAAATEQLAEKADHGRAVGGARHLGQLDVHHPPPGRLQQPLRAHDPTRVPLRVDRVLAGRHNLGRQVVVWIDPLDQITLFSTAKGARREADLQS